MAEVPFLSFWGADMNTEMGVVIYIYLKHSPDYIDSKHLWVHGSKSKGSSICADIPFFFLFFAFSALYRKRKRCSQVEPSPCYS